LLQRRNDEEARQEHDQGDRRHPGLRVAHVAEYTEQDARIEDEVRKLAPATPPTAPSSDTIIEMPTPSSLIGRRT